MPSRTAIGEKAPAGRPVRNYFQGSAIWYGIGIPVGVFLDQMTKFWAKTFLRWGNTVDLIPNWLTLSYAENSGIAFSFPLRGTFLMMVTAMLIWLLIWYFVRHFDGMPTLERMGFASVISWALWNGYDRFAHGMVADFISLKYFAIFNVADIVISMGALLIIFAQLRKKSHGY